MDYLRFGLMFLFVEILAYKVNSMKHFMYMSATKDSAIISSEFSKDVPVTSLLSCSYLCMETDGCCAASFLPDLMCRLDTSIGCNVGLSIHDGAITAMPRKDIIVTSLNIDITTSLLRQVSSTQDMTSMSIDHDDSTTQTGYKSTNYDYETTEYFENYPSSKTSFVYAMTSKQTSDVTTTAQSSSISDKIDSTTAQIASTSDKTDSKTTQTALTSDKFDSTTTQTALTSDKTDSTTAQTALTSDKPANTTALIALTSSNEGKGSLSTNEHFIITTEAVDGASTTTQPYSDSTLKAEYTTTATTACNAANYVFHETELTFIDAQNVCNGIGGKIVEIESAEKELCLRELFTQFGQAWYWIGTYNYNEDNVIEWWSNPEAPISYTNWGNNQPQKPHLYLCAIAKRASNYRWSCDDCAIPYAFICEIGP